MAIAFASANRVLSNAGTAAGAGNSLIDRKFFDTVQSAAGLPTLDTAITKWGGGSIKFDSTFASTSNVQTALNTSTYTIGVWFNVQAGTPSAAARFGRSGPSNHDIQISTTGILQVALNSVNPVNIFTPDRNRWYWLTVMFDTSGATHTVTARVYDDQGRRVISDKVATLATAATPQTNFIWGWGSTGGSVQINVEGPVWSDSLALLLPRRVHVLLPNGDGTHSFTLGDFQDNASVNIAVNGQLGGAGATGQVYTLLNEMPPNLTAFAKQTFLRTTSYLEIAFQDLPGSGYGAPELVQVNAALHPVGSANQNQSIYHLNDGGTITAEAVIDATQTADTLEYHRNGYQTRPNGGGAWDASSVNALLVRYGFSGDVIPPPAVDALYLEVVTPVTFNPVYFSPSVV